MHNLIFTLLLLPVQLFGQLSVKYVDTVTVSGYFYEFAWRAPYRVPVWKGAYTGDHHFVSDSMLGDRSVIQYLQSAYNKAIDKDKFLSKMPDLTFKPFEGADSATNVHTQQVITIVPFDVGAKGHRIGIKKYRAWVTRATIRWIKLRADAAIALHGFDRPPTIDVANARNSGFVNVYLPIQLQSMDKQVNWWKGSNPVNKR